MVIRLDRSVRRRFSVAVVFLTWLLLVRGAVELYSLSVPAATGPQPIHNIAGHGRSAALTFNVSWGEQMPIALLKTLAEYNVRVTFFTTGAWAEAHPDLIRDMAAAGHDVGSYGWHPLDLTGYDDEDLRTELQAAVTAVTGGTGIRPTLFRPPAGAHDSRVIDAAAELGLVTVLWDVDAQDWLQPDSEQITATVVGGVRPGSIVLLHAGETNVQTLRALPPIIRGLRERGFEPLPLSEMMGGSPPGSQDVEPGQ